MMSSWFGEQSKYERGRYLSFPSRWSGVGISSSRLFILLVLTGEMIARSLQKIGCNLHVSVLSPCTKFTIGEIAPLRGGAPYIRAAPSAPCSHSWHGIDGGRTIRNQTNIRQ